MTAQPSPQHSSPETFVIAKLGDGYRVYSPEQPQRISLVSGSPENPSCTCLAFRGRGDEADARCEHIEAVFGQPTPQPQTHGNGAADGAAGSSTTRALPAGPNKGVGVQMVLKRSVSPDGRIDSLSVEFSCDVSPLAAGDVHRRAMRMLEIQDAIANGFRQNGNHKAPQAAHVHANEGLPAQLMTVGGMDGKWGRRLFLVVQVGDKLLKFFGSEKQLAEAIAGAGFAGIGRVGEGMVLNLPCQVRTKPSPDGRYQNIEKILPAAPQ